MNHDEIYAFCEHPLRGPNRWIAIVVLDDRFDHGFVGGRALANLWFYVISFIERM